MENEVSVWNKVMGAALAMPGVKVDRRSFIAKELASYCTPEQLKKAIEFAPAKSLGKIIPLLGGVISGGLTLATFQPSARKLQKRLQQDMDLLSYRFSNTEFSSSVNENNKNEKTIYTDNEESNGSGKGTSEEQAVLMLLINMAKIDHNFTEKKREFLNEEIENSELTEDEQFALAQSYNINDSFQVDFSVLRLNDSCSIQLLRKLVLLCKLDGKITLAEKIYLKKVARELGYSPEYIEELINE